MIDVQALRALVEKWRATSDQMGNDVGAGVFLNCADELASLIPAPQEDDEALAESIATAFWALPKSSRDEWRALMRRLRVRLNLPASPAPQPEGK
jgi:hypothetical protein